MIPVFVISLPDCHDRWAGVSAALDGLGLYRYFRPGLSAPISDSGSWPFQEAAIFVDNSIPPLHKRRAGP